MKDIDESISLINKIVFEIEVFGATFDLRTITFNETQIFMVTERSLFLDPDQIPPYEGMTKAEFLNGLRGLHLGEWQGEYNNYAVFDGTQWSLEIYFSNKREPAKFSGSNAFPDNFKELLRLVDCESGDYL